MSVAGGLGLGQTKAPYLIIFSRESLRMNEVFKNTHVFVEVLSMARCDAVQQWDESAFEKAYKWASYFEEVSYFEDLIFRLSRTKTAKWNNCNWVFPRPGCRLDFFALKMSAISLR